MMKVQDIERNMTQNLSYYRKANGMTQSEVAEKLSYTCKAVSRWENGDSHPDIVALKQLADIYGINVDDFYREKPRKVMSKKTKRRLFTALISLVFIYLIAVIIYVIMVIVYSNNGSSVSDHRLWITFVYASLPAFILLVVLSAVWKTRFALFISETLLIWSLLTCIYVSLLVYPNDPIRYLYLIYTIGIPLQLLSLLQYFLHWTVSGAIITLKSLFHRHKKEEITSDESTNETKEEENNE